MGLINVVVKHDGTDITNSTISYNRDHDICTGIGTLELIVPLNISRTFKPWDVIEIWENGNKKAKFFIDSAAENAASGIIGIKATDGSKKLIDYFITDSYTIDYLSYGRTWIEKFLTEAGISYTFTVSGNGSPLSNNTSLGFDSASNTITTLLQQSGWYIYFDGDGDAIVGNLNKDVNDPDHSIDADDIQQIDRELDDERLRNRAVVWGNSNPTFGDVFVDISVPTPWNYDANDKRAVVLSNSSIYNNAQALELAQMMLKEFTKIKDERTLLVVNDYNLQIGEIVKVTTKYWSGRGLITGLTASMNENGLVYQVTINKKCPRLFTFFSEFPDTEDGFYVYAGTLSHGIWRKYSEGSSWYDDSSGLENLKINDLFIRNGTFAAVADDGYLYTRTNELSSWYKYYHPDLRDQSGVTYSNMDIRAVSCSINDSDNIVAGYNFAPITETSSGIAASGLAWVLELTGDRSLLSAHQVVVSGITSELSIKDLESAGEYNIVTINTSGELYEEGVKKLLSGYGNSPRVGQSYIQAGGQIFGGDGLHFLSPDSDHYSWCPPSGDVEIAIKNITSDSSNSKCGLIKDENNLFYCFRGDSSHWYFGVYDPENEIEREYTIRIPSEYAAVGVSKWRWYIKKITNTKFHIIGTTTTDSGTLTIKHWTYTFNDRDPVYQGGYSHAGSSWGSVLLGNYLIWAFYQYDGGQATKFMKYNLITKTGSTTTAFTYTDSMTPGGVKENHWRSILCPAGDTAYLITYWQEQEENYQCIFLPPSIPYLTEHNKIVMYGQYYKFTDYGSSTYVGPTIIDSVEVDTNNYANMSMWGPYVYGTDYAANPVTRNVYFRIRWIKQWSEGGNGWCGSGTEYHENHYCYFKVPSWTKINDRVFTVTDDPNEPDGEWNFDYNLNNWQYGSHLHSRYGGPWGIVSERVGSEHGYALIDWGTGNVVRWFNDESVDDPYHYTQVRGSGQRDDVRQMVEYKKEYIDYKYHTYLHSPRTWQQYTDLYPLYYYGYGIYGMIGKYPIGHGYGINSHTIYGDVVDSSEFEYSGSVLKHTPSATISGYTATDTSLVQDQGNFQTILDTKKPAKVDIAHGTPTVIYDVTVSGQISEDLSASLWNTPGSFYTHSDPKAVYESRTFNLPSPDAFPTTSGTFDPDDYERFIGICSPDGLLASKFDLSSPWVNLVAIASGVSASGYISHFETTNYVPEGTYIFYTISGFPYFFQKNPDESFWRDYSTGLPSSDITILRVDDII
jgi:hypothetical protein